MQMAMIKQIKVVEIEVNSNCNMACSYCPNEKYKRKENGKMSYELFGRILSELKTNGFKGRISFNFYNEPLLVNDLEYYVAKAKEELPEISIHLYTNGTKLGRARFDSLLNAGVDMFIVTKHENVTQFIFEETFIQLDDEVRKKYVILKNYTDIKLTNRGGLIELPGAEPIPENLPCSLPSHMITITVMGNIIPCFEDFDQIHEMGNIQTNSLEEIWNKTEYVKMRNMLLFGKRNNYEVCSKCNRREAMFI
jgi:radical SAM protein with 4Fe4S-binding SPASM domain